MNNTFPFRTSSINYPVNSQLDIENGLQNQVPQRTIENNNPQQNRATSLNLRTELSSLPRPLRRNETISNPVVSPRATFNCKGPVRFFGTTGAVFTTGGATALGFGIKNGIQYSWEFPQPDGAVYIALLGTGVAALLLGVTSCCIAVSECRDNSRT